MSGNISLKGLPATPNFSRLVSTAKCEGRSLDVERTKVKEYNDRLFLSMMGPSHIVTRLSTHNHEVRIAASEITINDEEGLEPYKYAHS
jgi:hypothetical protein